MPEEQQPAQEAQEQQSLPEPRTVLGVDPEEQQEPQQPEPEQKAVQPEQQQQSLPDDYHQAVEKASLYDTLMSDPQVVQFLQTHLRTTGAQTGVGSGGEEQSQLPENSEVPPWAQQGMQTIQQMQQTMQQMADRMGQQDLQLFKMAHPDYTQYQDDIVGLLREAPGIGLEKAYAIAKRSASGSAAVNGPQQPVQPTAGAVEGRGVGTPPAKTELEILREAEARIMDRKRNPGIDNAFDEAEAVARKIHGMR